MPLVSARQRNGCARYAHGMPRATARVVYVVDAWDDDAQESHVSVYADREAADRALARWKAKRASHDVYAGVLKRRVL